MSWPTVKSPAPRVVSFPETLRLGMVVVVAAVVVVVLAAVDVVVVVLAVLLGCSLKRSPRLR